MENGWIKLHNKFLKWEWYGDSNMVALWIHLLLSANWKDTRWMGIALKRGQLIFGRKEWSKKTGISQQTLRTCLMRLKSTNEITIKSTNKFSVITIVKWEEYQGRENNSTNTSTSKSTNEQPATNQQLTTPKEYKNIRYKDIVGRFTPPTPEQVKEYCLERNNGVNFDKWFNFYSAKGWMVGKNPMKDWKAAVRTWEEKKTVSYTEKPLPVKEYFTDDQIKQNLLALDKLKSQHKINKL